MKTLLVDIEDAGNLQAFLQAVKKLNFVKSVKLAVPENSESNISLVKEVREEYSWINPSRPASETEIDLLIDTMESSKGGYTTDEVKEKMGQWAAQK